MNRGLHRLDARTLSRTPTTRTPVDNRCSQSDSNHQPHDWQKNSGTNHCATFPLGGYFTGGQPFLFFLGREIFLFLFRSRIFFKRHKKHWPVDCKLSYSVIRYMLYFQINDMDEIIKRSQNSLKCFYTYFQIDFFLIFKKFISHGYFWTESSDMKMLIMITTIHLMLESCVCVCVW